MGRLVLSEVPGPLHGCRDDVTDGLKQVGERIVAGGADTVVILDTHWLSNAAYHVNAGAEFQGVFTSSEFPTQIEALEYDHAGETRRSPRPWPRRPPRAASRRWRPSAARSASSTARSCRCTS